MKRPWDSLCLDDGSDDEPPLILFKEAEEKPPTASEESCSAEGSKPPSASRASQASSASRASQASLESLFSESLESSAESHEDGEGLSSSSSGSSSISQSMDSDSNSESGSPSPYSSSSSGSELDPFPISTTVTTTTKLVSSTSSTTHPTLDASQQSTGDTCTPIVTASMEPESHLHPPHGVTLYSVRTSPASISASIYSYYQQRYTLFSRFDEGIWMTQNSWFEVTPERVGAKIAERVFIQKAGSSQTPKVVLDAFCGVGGNSIQFALSPHCERVFAIDNDPAAVWCARRNAELYGVLDKITFLVGDFFEFSGQYCDSKAGSTVAGQTKFDIVFGSPPWGGPNYRSHQVFDLETMRPHAFGKVWEATMKILRAQHNSNTEAGANRAAAALAVFYLPRTSNLNQLARYVGELGDKARADAVHYCCNLRSKAVCLYVGGVEDTNDPPLRNRSKNSDGDDDDDDEGTPAEVLLQKAGEVCNSVEDAARVDRIQGDNQSTCTGKKRKRKGDMLNNIQTN